MFNKKKNLVNSLSKLERVEEYKNVSISAIVYAARYCNKHRKEITSKDMVKQYFDKGLELYKNGACNKLEVDDA